MGQAITITNLAHSAADLRRLMSKQKGRVGCAAAYGAFSDFGWPVAERGSAAKWGWNVRPCATGCHRFPTTPRVWRGFVLGWAIPGPAPLLTEAQDDGVEGAGSSMGLILRGTRLCAGAAFDLRDKIEQHFGVKVHKRTVAKWLRQLELTRLQPRPCDPQKYAPPQEAFKKTSAA